MRSICAHGMRFARQVGAVRLVNRSNATRRSTSTCSTASMSPSFLPRPQPAVLFNTNTQNATMLLWHTSRCLSTRKKPPTSAQEAAEKVANIKLLVDQGYTEDMAEQALGVMAKGGVAPWELKESVERMGTRGIEALRESLLAENAMRQNSDKTPINVHFKVPKERHEFTIQAMENDDLEDLVGRGTEVADYIECTCGGNMACSTCHVYVDPEWMDRVGPPSDEEQDMLDLAYEPQDNSRLGCQLVFSKKMDGLTLTIPDKVNNMF